MDASIPEALIILNAAIANGYFDFPTGRVTAHKDFHIVAAANTFGTGMDNVYVGRNQLDAATLDRFAVVEFDYDQKVERALAGTREISDFIESLRETVHKLGMRMVVSMRATEYATQMDRQMEPIDVLKTIIVKGMGRDDLVQLKNGISGLGGNKYYKALCELADE